MLGFVFQRGRLPLSEHALRRAIELNGVVQANLDAFAWGRILAEDESAINSLTSQVLTTQWQGLPLADELRRYQSAYAQSFLDFSEELPKQADARPGDYRRLVVRGCDNWRAL